MKRSDGAAVVGVAAAACSVCCAGPIVGLLAAIGLGTALGSAVFGIIGVVIALLAIPVIVRHRRRRRPSAPSTTTPVERPTIRTPS